MREREKEEIEERMHKIAFDYMEQMKADLMEEVRILKTQMSNLRAHMSELEERIEKAGY